MPRYLELMRRIAATQAGQDSNSNIQWKRLKLSTMHEKYGTDDIWSVRASREIRLFVTRRGADVTVVDFVRRNDRSVYTGQREGSYT